MVELVISKVFEHFLRRREMFDLLKMLFEYFIMFFHVSKELRELFSLIVIIYFDFVNIDYTFIMAFRKEVLSFLFFIELF